MESGGTIKKSGTGLARFRLTIEEKDGGPSGTTASADRGQQAGSARILLYEEGYGEPHERTASELVGEGKHSPDMCGVLLCVMWGRVFSNRLAAPGTIFFLSLFFFRLLHAEEMERSCMVLRTTPLQCIGRKIVREGQLVPISAVTDVCRMSFLHAPARWVLLVFVCTAHIFWYQ